MDAASLARRIVVRHKEEGHLRLDLPAELTGPAARAHVEAGLRQRSGVYRVSFEPQGRLSIRFEPMQCTLQTVARDLRGLLDNMPAESIVPAPLREPLTKARETVERSVRKVRIRMQGLLGGLRRPGAPAGSLQARLQPVLQNALTEQAAINFLNDVLMFYLIRVHWDLITKRWMKNPVAYADAWLAIFYLVFLLVRYRKSLK